MNTALPFSNEEVELARQETPGCRNVLHFNSAGASLMPQPVVDALIAHTELEAEIGAYEAYDKQLDAAEHFYHATASLLNCQPNEIAFVENATRAWDMAFYSLNFQPGDRIFTSRAEYASNYIAYLQISKKTGAVVEAIPDDEYGRISLDALKNAIDERVKLISITHAPTNGGLINPAAEVGKIAREAGILYLLDACQSVGQLPIDVQAIGCDMLSATGRKYLRGPRATGFLYVKREVLNRLEPPFLDMHAATWTSAKDYHIRTDARRFENWEQNYAGKIGLAVAIDYAMHLGLEKIRGRVSFLADTLRAKLSEMPEITVADLGLEKSGIVTFFTHKKTPEQIKKDLKAASINVSVSEKSGTLLDMQARGLTNLVRASVHYFNTEEEVDRFCATLASIL
jgi:selenocysteine lyase/cysteine desulfurase